MSPPIPPDSRAAADGEDDAEIKPPPTPTMPACSVCMEPWACTGDHRICCIPCGHVYGRSCLEMWLRRCGNKSAKCPQCGEQYENKLITNLYAPGNLWESCYHLKEVREYHLSKIEELARMFESEHAKITAEIESIRAEQAESEARAMALASSCREKVEVLREQFAEWERKSNQQIATANADWMSMKARMKKMAEEEKATPADLIEFLEQNCPTLFLIGNPPPAPAPTPDVKKKRQRHHDRLPPVAELLGGPADAVKRRRRYRN